MLAVDQALTRLEQIDPTKARVVLLRYFAGLTIEETAAAMELSPATVKNEWAFARAWLHDALGSADADDAGARHVNTAPSDRAAAIFFALSQRTAGRAVARMLDEQCARRCDAAPRGRAFAAHDWLTAEDDIPTSGRDGRPTAHAERRARALRAR